MTKDLTPKQIRNREMYPEMAAFVDEMREVFGDVKFISFSGKAESPDGRIQQASQEVVTPIPAPCYLELPVNCKAAPSSKTDKRAAEKQRQLEQMIADGLIKLGGR